MGSNNQKSEIKFQKLPVRKVKNGFAIMPVKFTVINFGLKDITSELFETDDRNKTRWWLKLHPNFSNKGILTVEIHLISSNYSDLTEMKIRVIVTKKSHPYELYQENTNQDTKKKTLSGVRSWCFKAIFDKSHRNNNSKDEDLKLLVEFKTPAQNLLESTQYNFNLGFVHQTLEKREFSDLTIQIPDENCNIQEIHVHKYVLAGNSSYFHRLLLQNPTQTVLKIDIFSFEVMQDIINFIYRKSLEHLETCATEIYEAAVKFELENLRKILYSYISDHYISKNQVGETVQFANKHKMEELLGKSLRFIKSNISEEDFEFLKSLNDQEDVREIVFSELTKNLPELNVPEYSPLKSPISKSSKVYGKMFETDKYADVVLKTKDGLRIMAHKFVLAANSQVFDSMLEGPKTESQYKELKIDDVDFPTLKALLKFIYCEKVDANDLTLDLLVAAKRFEIEDLVIECSSYLRANLTVRNAIELFIQVEDDELKNDAIIFIGRNYNHLIGTSEWEAFVDEFPGLFAELLNRWRSYTN